MPMIDMHVSVEKLTKTNLDEMLFDQIGVRDFHFLGATISKDEYLRVCKCKRLSSYVNFHEKCFNSVRLLFVVSS